MELTQILQKFIITTLRNNIGLRSIRVSMFSKSFMCRKSLFSMKRKVKKKVKRNITKS